MKVAINGFLGQMGQSLYNLLKSDNEIEVVCGIDKKQFNQSTLNNFSNLLLSNNIYDAKNCDVIIDFSSYLALEQLLDFCVKNKKALIIATTGHSTYQEQAIYNASKFIPIFKSGNFSQGVYIFLQAIKEVAKKTLDFDVEIIETHHNKKVDVPSGTAKMMFNEVKGVRLDSFANVGRRNTLLKKKLEEIGIHSIRGGGVVGQHKILFLDKFESISITHTAFSREVFCVGVIKACKFIKNKDKGLYEIKNLFE